VNNFSNIVDCIKILKMNFDDNSMEYTIRNTIIDKLKEHFNVKGGIITLDFDYFINLLRYFGD
jgi:hypothetical protein